jgi:hypothetical protein
LLSKLFSSSNDIIKNIIPSYERTLNLFLNPVQILSNIQLIRNSNIKVNPIKVSIQISSSTNLVRNSNIQVNPIKVSTGKSSKRFSNITIFKTSESVNRSSEFNKSSSFSISKIEESILKQVKRSSNYIITNINTKTEITMAIGRQLDCVVNKVNMSAYIDTIPNEYEFSESEISNMIYPWIAYYNPYENIINFFLFIQPPKSISYKKDYNGTIYEIKINPGGNKVYFGQIDYPNLMIDSNSNKIPDILEGTIEGSLPKLLKYYEMNKT